jgi:CrcB protein
MNIFWVFLGGGIGSAVRYLFGVAFSKTSLTLPMATLSANLSSCLIFGITLLMFHNKPEVFNSLKLFVLVGVCGGLSTFSTFSSETFELLKVQQYFWATANIVLNTVLCLLIFYIFSKLY